MLMLVSGDILVLMLMVVSGDILVLMLMMVSGDIGVNVDGGFSRYWCSC